MPTSYQLEEAYADREAARGTRFFDEADREYMRLVNLNDLSAWRNGDAAVSRSRNTEAVGCRMQHHAGATPAALTPLDWQQADSEQIKARCKKCFDVEEMAF